MSRSFTVLLLLLCITACNENSVDSDVSDTESGFDGKSASINLTQISEKPGGSVLVATTRSHPSTIGLRLRIDYQDLAAIAATEVPEQQDGEGTKRICKKVIGIKVCGTARWIYTVRRTGDIGVSGSDDRVVLDIPLQFDGNAGIRGRLAQSLGMRKLDFTGALNATVGLSFDLSSEWCPVITSQIDYIWTQAPKAEWAGGIDIDLKSKLDEAIAKQLETVDDKIKESIDCEEFRAKLQSSWRQYSFPLDLPLDETESTDAVDLTEAMTTISREDSDETESQSIEIIQEPVSTFGDSPSVTPSSEDTTFGTAAPENQVSGNKVKQGDLYLNLEPQNFGFSGMHTETERLGVTFSLVANASVDPVALEQTELELPMLERVPYVKGSTEFDLPVRVGYEQLEALARPEIEGRVFTSESSAGVVTVEVHTIEIYGSEQGLTIGLTFDADLPATSSKTRGELYLTTNPVVDSFNRQLTLTETSLSKVLDSTLWRVLATVFETKIIKSIEEKAVINLGDRLDDLHERLLIQIGDQERTGGLIVSAENLSVNLTELFVEREALVLVVRAGAKLDINVPSTILKED